MKDDFKVFWLFVLLVATLLFGMYMESEANKYENTICEMGENVYFAIQDHLADSLDRIPTRTEIAKYYITNY